MPRKDYAIDVIIPCYHSKDTLPETLDSLVSQTFKDFLVTIVIDADGEDYSSIIKTYKKRGLNIQLLELEKNSGPGVARQYGIDHTHSSFLSFVDSDDALVPQALYILHYNMVQFNYDLISSSILREDNERSTIIPAADSTTWVLGKMYKREYLERINLKFRKDLRLSEDCYFNLVAFNCTENKAGFDNWYLGVWKGNENSLTRRDTPYYFDTHNVDSYIKAQVNALLEIVKNTGSLDDLLFTITMCLCYVQVQQALFEDIEYPELDDEFRKLSVLPNVTAWTGNLNCWNVIMQDAPICRVYPERIVIFKETFIEWFNRVFHSEQEEE